MIHPQSFLTCLFMYSFYKSPSHAHWPIFGLIFVTIALLRLVLQWIAFFFLFNSLFLNFFSHSVITKYHMAKTQRTNHQNGFCINRKLAVHCRVMSLKWEWRTNTALFHNLEDEWRIVGTWTELAGGFSLIPISLVGQQAGGHVCFLILICANGISKQVVCYSWWSNLIVNAIPTCIVLGWEIYF